MRRAFGRSPSPPPQRCHGGSSLGAAARRRPDARYAAPRVPSPSSERPPRPLSAREREVEVGRLLALRAKARELFGAKRKMRRREGSQLLHERVLESVCLWRARAVCCATRCVAWRLGHWADGARGANGARVMGCEDSLCRGVRWLVGVRVVERELQRASATAEDVCGACRVLTPNGMIN